MITLPRPLTPLIGRTRDVERLAGLVGRDDVRLVTITGPAGVGKTRLALAVASVVEDDYPDGVGFVGLGAVANADLLLSTIGQSVGLRDSGDRPLADLLADYLRDRPMLLVLDNFEHLLAAAPVVAELLARSAPVKVIVTSRAVLRLRGEHEYQTSPLPAPRDVTLVTSSDLERYGAVALFVQQARTVQPDFTLSPSNAALVGRICARLDGLPLAIELAAARLRLLSLAELLARLERPLAILTGGARDLPPRLQTLRDAIGWSYDLLDVDERAVFRRLAVFAGGCSIEAAEDVADTPHPEQKSVLDVLASLVDKSLLRQEDRAVGVSRLTMLETVRDYAFERLVEAGDAETARLRHLAYFTALAEAAASHRVGREQGDWFDRLEEERDNLRVTLRFALDRSDAVSAYRLAAALWPFWLRRGYLTEGRGWLGEILVLDSAPPEARAAVLVGAGTLAHYQGDLATATALAGQALRLYRALGDTLGVAAALDCLALVARTRGDYAGAVALYDEALSLLSQGGDAGHIAHTLFYKAITLWHQSENAAAGPTVERALVGYRSVGDEVGVSYCQGLLGSVAMRRGDLKEGRALLEAAIATARWAGDRKATSRLLHILAEINLAEGDTAGARGMLEESLALVRELGDRPNVAWNLEGLASVANAEGEPEYAALLFGTASALRDELAVPVPHTSRVTYEHAIAATRRAVSDPVFSAAWSRGRLLTSDQALALRPASTEGRLKESRLLVPALVANLTQREGDVLRLVARGMTTAQIADRLVVSTFTVNAHLRSIYGKIDVSSRSAATRFALEHGMT